MDLIIAEIIKDWGLMGALLIGMGWMIYDIRKSSKNNKADSDSVKKHVSQEIGLLDKKIDIVDHKVDCVESNLHDRIDSISTRLDDLPEANADVAQKRADDANKDHIKQITDLMLLGDSIHKTLKKYTKLTKADHIFIGSFHNGNSNLSGIPFCKFDLISECYADKKIKHDHEFAPVYKDSDILRYGSLFSVILQNDCMHFNVDPEGQNDMAQYEDIIWRRMVGLGIKQMAIKILRDPDNIPSGFVGIVRYDNKEMNMEELIRCGTELERVYSINKYKIQDADKE